MRKTKKSTKRLLLSSFMLMLIYSAMLVGATYAYFSDTITNSGNKIQSGILDISLFSTEVNYMHIDPTTGVAVADPTTTSEIDLTNLTTAAYTAENVSPADSGYINLSIRPSATNTLPFSYEIYVIFADDIDDAFFGVLGFKIDDVGLVYTDSDENTPGTQVFVKSGIWFKSGENGTNGANIDFTISWLFDETAGNEFQNKELSFDILVIAEQISLDS